MCSMKLVPLGDNKERKKRKDKRKEKTMRKGGKFLSWGISSSYDANLYRG